MMVHLTIDGQPVEVEEGTTILQAAKKACIHIPTLCYHEDLSIKAVCRICVVEVEGQRLLPTAWHRMVRSAGCAWDRSSSSRPRLSRFP